MAGRRQHYLPLLLQRGFLDKESGEAERSWLHRKGGPPRLVGIRDVGVGEYFYSRPVPGEVTLDDMITDLEGDLSKVIDGYRAIAFGKCVDAWDAARTVHHLITRTAHIRSLLDQASTRFFEEIEALLDAPDKLAAIMGLGSTELSPLVIDKIRESAGMLLPFGVPEALSERLFTFYLREKAPGHLAEASVPMRKELQSIQPEIAGMVRETHDKILSLDPAEHRWIERLAAFEWHVAEAEQLILPDCVGLASDGAGPLVPLLLCDGESAASVALPVASNRMLVGVAPGAVMIDLVDFNARAAACCDNFFIAAAPVVDLDLVRSIGTEGAPAIDAAISAALIGAGAIDTSLPRAIAELGATDTEFAYTFRLEGVGDQALAEQLNDVVHQVIAVLARHLPLGSLDGFTVAADYVGALASVDRGTDLPPVETTALAYGAGVANTVPVVRDGTAKTHVVIAAGVAMSWLNDDPAIRAWALNILVKMLAYIGHDAGYGEQLATEAFEPDLITSMLHPAVRAAPRGWYSAREGAFVAPDIGKSYADLVLEGLAFGRAAMADARIVFEATQDIEPLVVTALECASAILAHAADWLGHRAGLAEGADFAGADLPSLLTAWDLADWIELYGRDLAAIYETADGRIDASRAMSISPHVERLLWTIGLLAWPEEDSVRWLPFDPGPAPVIKGMGAGNEESVDIGGAG
ncbi:hypothetical protein D6851_15630 [Altericroceibacterium spongiae]|uniref:DUF4238 domain-containing protein n=1 Tax=Altericroceibacterium spongiae TaxID=2320269 RepID=A0A420EAK4_9SPHN|nr:hypothetical protein [Altericroceibacterium spongiae]RKF17690.1 hypothetical protein D6851_15630 [Altericroceibacterium spongiae]